MAKRKSMKPVKIWGWDLPIEGFVFVDDKAGTDFYRPVIIREVPRKKVKK